MINKMLIKVILAFTLVTLAFGVTNSFAGDHGGKAMEHAGKEHAGKAAKSKGMGAKTEFSASEIKMAMMQHINAKVAADGGVFKIGDPKSNNKELRLNFVKIHDPVRKIEGRGYFACTDFSVAGDTKGKLYDLDFWLSPKNGKLLITETKIHKEPKLTSGSWQKVARYTFVNDKVVEIQ